MGLFPSINHKAILGLAVANSRLWHLGFYKVQPDLAVMPSWVCGAYFGVLLFLER